jgi:hypothetical protein
MRVGEQEAASSCHLCGLAVREDVSGFSKKNPASVPALGTTHNAVCCPEKAMLAKAWKRLFSRASPHHTPLPERGMQPRWFYRSIYCAVFSLQTRPPIRAMLRDLSETGCGLLCDEALEPGKFLSMRFRLRRPL